jgi:8-oxo-dGTP pyrophosphatase MutT (NUDIX family)
MSNQRGRQFTGRVVHVDVEDVTLPNGHVSTYEFVRHPGGSAVVALDEQRRVCLLRQWRPAVGEWVWELPAGKRDDGEDPAETARRELAEEAGRVAARWTDLGSHFPSPGVFCEVLHLYLAEGLSETPSALEPGEVLEVHWVPLAVACAQALEGPLRDAKTIIGLLRAAALRPEI